MLRGISLKDVLGALFGGHVRFVFTFVLFIFIFCVLTTLTSFKEIPLNILTNPFKRKSLGGHTDAVYNAVPVDDAGGRGEDGGGGGGGGSGESEDYGAIQMKIT